MTARALFSAAAFLVTPLAAYQLGRIAETGNRMYDTPATCMQTDTLIIHRDRRLPPQPYHVRGAP